MAYCTLDDIKSAMDEHEIIGYTDDEDTGSINMDHVDDAITGAGSLIDTYLGGRFPLPLSPVPEIVKSMAVDIAVYKISSRRGSAPDEARTKFEDAVKLLKSISTGQAILPGVEQKASTTGSARVKMTSSPRVFTRDSMRGI